MVSLLTRKFWWLGLGLSLLVSCSTTDPEAPHWWQNPHRDDQWNLYVKASAEGDTEEQARQKAYNSALVHISKKIIAKVDTATARSSGTDPVVQTVSQLKNTKIVDEKSVCRLGKWTAWVLVTYPVAERNKLLNYLNWPHQQYQKALQLIEARKYPEGKKLLNEILIKYPIGQQEAFLSERIYLDFARMARNQKKLVAARKAYEKLISTSKINRTILRKAKQELRSLPKPKSIDKVREEIDGRKIALACVDVKSNKLFKYRKELAARIHEFQINAFPLDYQVGNQANMFQAAKAKGASFVLLMKLKVIPNFKPIKDSDISWCIVNTQWTLYSIDKKRLGAGSFQSRWSSTHPQAEKVASVVAVNILFTKKMEHEVHWHEAK